MPLKFQLEYVLHLRGSIPSSSKTVNELKTLIGIISSEESKAIDKWDRVTGNIPGDVYPGYTASGLIEHLTGITGYVFPMRRESFNNVSVGKQAVVALYHMNAGLKVEGMKVFTNDQELLCSFEEGLYIANAGPGTGKTTVGIERTLRMKDEGVLIISYSNAAIEEVYNRLKAKGVTGVGLKKYDKKINVATLDSLAWMLNGKPVINAKTNHAKTVEAAIRNIGQGKYLSDYKHIIVDEAQDIDEPRGEMVKGLYASGKYKSMLILGDPRQRINEAGLWYSNMWINGGYDNPYAKETKVCRAPSFDDVKEDMGDIPSFEGVSTLRSVSVNKITAIKVGLKISHRFKTQLLVNLHNDLSRTRPELHIELQPSSDNLPAGDKVAVFNVETKETDKGMIKFGSYLFKTYINTGIYTQDDICIATPSVNNATNKTSASTRRLCAVLKAQGRNVFIHGSDPKAKKKDDHILVSTINSIKGKEFKLVILYCMNQYPRFQPQVAYKEGDSMVYVANTRAKERIIYLAHRDYDGRQNRYREFSPPRGVPATYFVGLNGIGIVSPEDDSKIPPVRVSSVTEMVNSFGWTDLVKINDYYMTVDSKVKYPSMVGFNMGDPRLNGVFAGLIIETLVIGDYLDVFKKIKAHKIESFDDKTYDKMCRGGFICKGFIMGGPKKGYIAVRKKGANTITDDEIKRVKYVLDKKIEDLRWKDWAFLTQVFDFIQSKHAMARYDIIEPTGIFPYASFKEIADKLISTFGDGDAEVHVKYSYISGMCDLVFNNTVVELKLTDKITDQHRYQAMVYACCLSYGMVPYVYNLMNGDFEKISSNKPHVLWKHIIDVYSVIDNHYVINNIFKNSIINDLKEGCDVVLQNAPLHGYVCDVNYTPNGEITDIAMINLSNPFKSIVTPIFTEDMYAIDYLLEHTELWGDAEPKEMYTRAPTIGVLKRYFNYIGGKDKSTVYHCLSHHSSTIPNMCGFKTVDVSAEFNVTSKKDHIKIANTSNAYSVMCNIHKEKAWCPTEYLRKYTPLANALMLHQMYHVKVMKL